jgi:hypothetical protein
VIVATRLEPPLLPRLPALVLQGIKVTGSSDNTAQGKRILVSLGKLPDLAASF